MRVIIRAVPARAGELHDYLRERLPDATWLMEQDEVSKAAGTRALIRAFREQGTAGAVHLEDDVILTRDFNAKVAAAVGPYWTRMVQMFSQRKEDTKVGSRWEAGSSFINAQAFYVPGSLAAPLADFYENDLDWDNWPGGTPMDAGIATFLKERKLRYRVHVPSLVQHRGVKSTVSHAATGWHSPTFVDPWE